MEENFKNEYKLGMKKCPVCSKPVSVAARVCPHCGADYEKIRREEFQKEQEKEREEFQKNAERLLRRSKDNGKARFCPCCGEAVRFSDEICKECGFPVGDKKAVKNAKRFERDYRELKRGGHVCERNGYAVASAFLLFAVAVTAPVDLGLAVLIGFFLFVALLMTMLLTSEVNGVREKLRDFEENYDANLQTYANYGDFKVRTVRDYSPNGTLSVYYVMYCPYCGKEEVAKKQVDMHREKVQLTPKMKRDLRKTKSLYDRVFDAVYHEDNSTIRFSAPTYRCTKCNHTFDENGMPIHKP